MPKLNEVINSSAWHLLWFNNPDIDVVVTDKNAGNRIRKLGLDAILETRKGLLNDTVLSNLLSCHAFYLHNGKFKQLMDCVSKVCNSPIDTDVSVAKFIVDEDAFLIAKYIKCPVNQFAHSISAQSSVQQDEYRYKRALQGVMLLKNNEFCLIKELYK